MSWIVYISPLCSRRNLALKWVVAILVIVVMVSSSSCSPFNSQQEDRIRQIIREERLRRQDDDDECESDDALLRTVVQSLPSSTLPLDVRPLPIRSSDKIEADMECVSKALTAILRYTLQGQMATLKAIMDKLRVRSRPSPEFVLDVLQTRFKNGRRRFASSTADGRTYWFLNDI